MRLAIQHLLNKQQCFLLVKGVTFNIILISLLNFLFGFGSLIAQPKFNFFINPANCKNCLRAVSELVDSVGESNVKVVFTSTDSVLAAYTKKMYMPYLSKSKLNYTQDYSNDRLTINGIDTTYPINNIWWAVRDVKTKEAIIKNDTFSFPHYVAFSSSKLSISKTHGIVTDRLMNKIFYFNQSSPDKVDSLDFSNYPLKNAYKMLGLRSKKAVEENKAVVKLLNLPEFEIILTTIDDEKIYIFYQIRLYVKDDNAIEIKQGLMIYDIESKKETIMNISKWPNVYGGYGARFYGDSLYYLTTGSSPDLLNLKSISKKKIGETKNIDIRTKTVGLENIISHFSATGYFINNKEKIVSLINGSTIPMKEDTSRFDYIISYSPDFEMVRKKDSSLLKVNKVTVKFRNGKYYINRHIDIFDRTIYYLDNRRLIRVKVI